jgi:hypothetical protein
MENEELLDVVLDELRTLNQTQKDISFTLKVLARSEIEKRLAHIFKNRDEILIYQLSNGENPSTEIAKFVSITGKSISRLWQKWEEEFGIVETEGYRNPYHGKYSLEELALLFGKLPVEEVIEEKE